MKKATKKEILSIKELFLQNFNQAVTELHYKNAYELLVCVMLSAQCTDKRVNIITPALFNTFPDVKSLSLADIEVVKSLIHSCSFFNNKANNLIKMAQKVVDEYNGNIPLDENLLVGLAGVGQKTAHVVMIEYTKANLMAVDTHVFRVAHRLGLSQAKTATKTEEDLTKLFQTELDTLHQAMVLFGRYTCKAKNPLCEACFLKEFCKTTQTFKV